MSDDGRLCVICGAPSTTTPADPVPVLESDGGRSPQELPPVDLCQEHWEAYRSDWLLLGWCVDHYGQALTHCPVHHREIAPI
jgi:hypothetical protein